MKFLTYLIHSTPLAVGIVLMILNSLYYDPAWPPPADVPLGLSGESFATKLEIDARADYFTRFDRAKYIFQIANLLVVLGGIWLLCQFWVSLKKVALFVSGILTIFFFFNLLDLFYLPLRTPLADAIGPSLILTMNPILELGVTFGFAVMLIGIVWLLLKST